MRDLKQVDFSQLSNETSSDYDEELKRKRERERKYEELKKQAKQESEREEAEKKAQSPYEQLKRQAKQEAMAADSAKVDSAYINSFLNDASNFLTSSKSSLDNTSWASAMDIGARERREASSRDLSYRADLISYYLDHNGAGMDKSTAEELRSYLDAYRTDAFNLSEAHKSYNQFYSQWATEDDYNTSVRTGGYSKKYDGMTSDEIDQVLGTLDDGEEKEWLTAHRSSVRYDEMLKYDTESATKQVNDLKDILDQMEAIKGRIQIAQNMPTYTPGYSSNKSVIAGYEAELAKLEQKYGSYESIKAQYNQKSAYLSNAKRIQEGVELASVADGNSENYDPGFAFESKYTPNDDWYDSLEFSDVLYDEANGVKRATPVTKSWADKITAAKQMTEEELAIFNYWYNNEGWDKAEKYLDSIMDELNLRVAKNRFADMKGNTALELLFSLEAGYDQFLSGAQNLFNTEDSYIPVSSTQILSGMVRKDLGDNGFKLPELLGGASLGQAVYDVGTTTANMAPSILTSAALGMVNPTLGKVAGNALMGASAAGNAYAEKINLGYSKDEARSYGLMVGASEATLQYLLGGIGKLGGNGLSKVAINNLDKVDNILARVAKSTGGKIFLNGVSEGFEEGLQAILEPYLWQAVSGEEGSVNWEETLYSSLLGFVTGGVFESPGAIVRSAGQNIGYYKTGADISNAGGTDALMALANEVAGVAPANMQNAIQKQSSKVDKKATSRRVGKLYDTVQSATSQADISQSLQAKGFSKETANDIAAAVIASNNGRDLSSSQRKLLKLVEKNSVAREAIASAMSSPQSSVGQKMREFQSGVARGNVTQAASAELGKAGNITEGNLTTTAETAAEARYEVAEDGKTIDGNGNVISITGISSIEKGRMVLQTEDGKTVDAREVSYGSQDEALVYEAVANLEGIIDGETATKLAKHLLKLGNASSNVYVNGIVQAYTYGYYGYGREAMIGKNTLSATLSEEQRNVAYGLAEQYRAAKTEADQKAAPGKKRIAGEVAGKKRSVAPDRTEYKKVRFEGEIKKWSEKQKAEVEFIDFIAANFAGNTVRVYESYKNAKGQYVYKDSNGKIHAAPNGVYIDSTGDIYLDLNAGNHGEGLVMNTFAHELYHHIERESPKKARKLAEFLVQELGYENVEIAVQRQIDKAKRAGHGVEYLMKENGISRTAAERMLYDRAFSDFVADSLETMFTEGNVVEALQKLKSQDAGLFNMIKSFIDKWVKRIRQFYRSHSTISIEGDMVSHLKKFEQIQQMFAEALVDAGENFQTSVTEDESQALFDVGIGFDNETRVAYSLRYSLAYKETIHIGKKSFDAETIAQILAKGTGRSIADAKKWVQSEMTIANIVMQAPEFLDFEADSRYEAIKKNSDYPQGTVDLSNLCPKREEFTTMFDMLQKKYPNKLFTAQDVADMRKILSDNDITVACGACFVEDRRQLIGEIADTFIGMWREAVTSGKPLQKTNAAGNKIELQVTKALAKQYGLTAGTKIMATDTYIPNQYDLTTYEGFKKLEKSHPTIAMAFNRYNNSRGQQSARLIEGRAEYKRQILGWSDAKVRSVNSNGGLRIFSFSDFEVVHLLDLVQVIIDCAAKGVKIQGYTKIPAFAKLVRDTGIKLNRSLIPKGDYGYHMENGKVVLDYDTTEGINIEDKDFIDESNNPNVGNIVIGINPTQIGAAMLDPFIDYIIPFHSNKSKEILKKLGTGEWVNYKESQHEKDISTGTSSKHNVNIYTEVINKYHPTNKVEFVEAFLKECKRQGKIPRYAEFLKVDENGDYAYREGYHKLLVDFKMFDTEGNILPQGNITPKLEESFMTELLNAEIDKKQSYEFPQKVYDAIDKKFGENGLDNSPAGNENRLEGNQARGEVNDNRRIREGAAQTAEVSGTDGGRHSDYSGAAREAKSFGDLSTSTRKRITSTVDNHIANSPNYEEFFDLLCRIANKSEDEITPAQLRKAIRQISETIYADAVAMHSVIFENRWSIFGDNVSKLRKDIHEALQAEYKESHKGAKFSDRDSEGNQLSEDQLEFFRNSQVRDKKGNLLIVYHGTTANFNIFKKGDVGYHFGTKGAARGRVGYGKNVNIKSVYLNITNPIVFDEDLGSWDADYRLTRELYDRGILTMDEAMSVLRTDDGRHKRSTESANKKLVSVLVEKGFDGIAYQNTFETKKATTSYIAFSSNQAKETTNISPTSNPDIRYSDRDSEGRRLTKEQQEYFKDSKVRDENGDLKVMYHGTSRGGHTVFDTWGKSQYGLFGTGSYFTESRDIAESYTKKGKGNNPQVYESYLNIINPLDMDAPADPTQWANAFADVVFPKSGTNEDFYRAVEEYYADQYMPKWEVAEIIRENIEFGMGYDGITHIGGSRVNADGERHRVYIVFQSEQVKDVDNAKPTDNPNIHYSERTNDSVSNRSLLANAFEGAAQTDMEKQKIQEYRGKIDLMNGQEQKLRKLNQQIKELSFAKGKRDTAKIRELRDEATKTANRISIYDKQLLRLESSKPLQDVLEREKKKAYQRAEKKGKEALAAYRQKAEAKQQEIIERYQESRKKGAEGRKRTALRHKIRTFKDKLVKSLEHPTDRVYVPAGLINAMVDVCNLIDTDTDLYKKDGIINKAQEQRNLTKEKLQNLKDEYERLKDNPDPLYKGEFDEMVYAYLTQLRENAKGKSINEMSLDELSEMYEILRGIEETLQDARKLIGWGEAEDVYEAADAIISEQGAISERRKDGKRSAAQKAKDATLDLSLSPVRNVERMSGYNQDSSLLKLFKKFEQGVRKKNKFTMDAYKSFGGLTSGKEYDDAVYAEFGKKYVDANGRKFSLSKMQMMQAILSMERELANGMSHIENSGFSFADLDMLRKGKLREAISEEYSHRVPAAVDMVAEFSTALKDDQWCQDYMKAARNFFNATAKDAINETMMVLKHRIVAKDKSYIPFEVDKNFVTREISAENDIQQTINAYGMLKETKKGAPQPLIVTGLNNVIDRHIDMVGNVYGLAVEVRNFNKVWNVRSMDATSGDPTVKAIIQKNWGNGGVKHIEQAVQDIQGPRHNEQSWLYRKVKSGYIGATFLLNLSVVTKQIGSLFSANSMLNWRDPGRQIGNLLWTMANSKKISAEVDKYTASAWMRRQGLSDAELHTFMTEGRKSKLGRLTSKMPSVINPAKWITAMDHAVALSLWRYAKIDTQKRTGLKGEDLLKATAEFYDEVIENTQSMTDVLHRPEIQKKNGVIAESFAMFKTDLYQMAGQLNVAAGRFAANKSKENAKILGRTVYSIAMSAIWGQLMTTVFALLRYKVNQYRDDEDKDLTVESWLKRQGYSFAGDIMGYIFPIFGSEVVGMFENIMYGESEDIVDSVAITAVNDLYDTMLTVATAIKDGEMPNPSDLKKLSIKALQVFGIPANNIIRTYEAVTLHAKDLANGEFFSFEAGVDRSAGNHIHRIVEAVDAGKIDVAMGMYEEAVEETAKGMSEEDLKNASSSLKTALGEHYKEGKTTRETAEKILADLFGMDDNDIYWTLDKWDYTKENGSAEGYSKYGEYYAAVAGNDRTTANMLYDRLIAEKVAEGYLRSEAKDSIASSFTTQVKNEYMDGEISRSKAIDLLTANTDNGEAEVKKWDFELEHGFSWSARVKGYRLGKISERELISAVMDIEGESREEAEEYIRFLDLEMANQDISITASEASSYFEHAEPAGIAIDVYLDYKNKAKDITGEGKKKRRMDVIHSLPLTSAQKDALYYAEGWSASTIHEAPWH